MGANWSWLWPTIGGVVLVAALAWRFGLPLLESFRTGLDAYETDELIDHLRERVSDEKNDAARKAKNQTIREKISDDEPQPPKQ